MNLEVSNDMAELPRARAELEKAAAKNGLSKEVLYALQLSLEEIFANIVNYGYSTGQKGSIKISLEVDSDAATLQMEDDGRPFNPLNTDAPNVETSLSERSVGGLGIHLVRKSTDQITYHRLENRNVLAVRKNLSSVS